jgi:FtsH-binding integral membrane protein
MAYFIKNIYTAFSPRLCLAITLTCLIIFLFFSIFHVYIHELHTTFFIIPYLLVVVGIIVYIYKINHPWRVLIIALTGLMIFTFVSIFYVYIDKIHDVFFVIPYIVPAIGIILHIFRKKSPSRGSQISLVCIMILIFYSFFCKSIFKLPGEFFIIGWLGGLIGMGISFWDWSVSEPVKNPFKEGLRYPNSTAAPHDTPGTRPEE